MHIIIIGFGSIGKRHYENLNILFKNPLITIWHISKAGTAQWIQSNIREVFCEEDAFKNLPDAAIISCPASFHIKYSQICVERGVHCFIEKPLSNNLEGVESLMKTALKNKVVIMVGYNLRYIKSLQIVKEEIDKGTIGNIYAIRSEVGQYLPDWRPHSNYRMSVSAQKSLGGGAIFELSHEIDYVIWLMGNPKSLMAFAGTLGTFDIDVEDYAEIILQFSENRIASINVNFLERYPTRSCKIIGETGTIRWDGIENKVEVYNISMGQWKTIYHDSSYDKNESYVRELITFFDHIRKNEYEAYLISAKRVLEVAVEAHRFINEFKGVKL